MNVKLHFKDHWALSTGADPMATEYHADGLEGQSTRLEEL